MEQDTPARAAQRQVRCTGALFTSSEMERIAKVGLVTQRDWRRRGFLPSEKGHVRADLFALTHCTALGLLAVRTGPLLATGIATETGLAMASHVLRWSDAYEGDVDLIGPLIDPVASERGKRIGTRMRPLFSRALSMSPEEIRQLPEIRDQIVLEEGGDGFNSIAWLRANILRSHNLEVRKPHRFMVWWADATHEFTDDLNGAFDSGVTTDPRFDGVPMVLDLDALAAGVVERAGRAFFHIELEDVEEAP